MRSIFCVLLIAAFASPAHANDTDDGITVTGTYTASRLSAFVPLDTLLKQKSWNGDEDDSPPVSCEEVLKTTREELLKAYPELRELKLARNLVLREISMVTANEGKPDEYFHVLRGCWMYCVTYQHIPVVSDHLELDMIQIPVIMLMDRSTFVAKRPVNKAPN